MATRIQLFLANLHSQWPYSRAIFVCVTLLYRRTNLVRTPTSFLVVQRQKLLFNPGFLSKNYSSEAQQNSVSFFSLSSFVRQLQKKTADVLFFRAECVINVSFFNFFFSFSFVFVFSLYMKGKFVPDISTLLTRTSWYPWNTRNSGYAWNAGNTRIQWCCGTSRMSRSRRKGWRTRKASVTPEMEAMHLDIWPIKR